jgi:hypothetical protein
MIIFIIGGCCRKYKVYRVKIVNESSSEITDVYLGMIGAKKGGVAINKLASGASTKYYEFLLLKNPKGPIPISYGDYTGGYVQKEVEKGIFVPVPDLIITIKINDKSYSIEGKK